MTSLDGVAQDRAYDYGDQVSGLNAISALIRNPIMNLTPTMDFNWTRWFITIYDSIFQTPEPSLVRRLWKVQSKGRFSLFVLIAGRRVPIKWKCHIPLSFLV